MKKTLKLLYEYESPEIVLETIESEGFLCTSTGHEDFTIDDTYGELFEED